MPISLNPDVRARLDAHLDAVEDALIAAGSSRERRRGVVDDLEAQITDMLAARSEAPMLADLEAVLATLDPPAAYGQSTAGAPPSAPPRPVTPAPMARPRYSRAAIAGLICILVSLIPLPIFAVLAFFMAAPSVSARTEPISIVAQSTRGNVESPRAATTVEGSTTVKTQPAAVHYHGSVQPVWRQIFCMLLFIAPLGLAGTVLGWIAFAQIRSSGGMLRGTGLALFDGLFYPGLVLLLVPLSLAA
jgi:hypothetical protein